MKEVIHIEIGKRKIRLIPILGKLLALAGVFGVLDSTSATYQILQFPLSDVVLGKAMRPIAFLFLWLGLIVFGTMVSRSEKKLLKK